MMLCAVENTLKNSQVGDYATGVEVLVAIKDYMIPIVGDFEIIIARIDGPY